jgi:hypothetical protein
MLFSHHMDENRMIELFFNEVGRSLRRPNLSATQDGNESPFGNEGLVAFRLLPAQLQKISGVEVNKSNGEYYICLY